MKYQAIFSGETAPNQLLGKKGVFIASLTLHEEQPDAVEKKDKFLSGIERLQTAATTLDFVATEVLNKYNFEIINDDSELAEKQALDNFSFWKTKYFDYIGTLNNLNKSWVWSELLEQENYSFCSDFTSALYNNDLEFKRRVCKTAAARIEFLMTDLNKNKLTKSFSPEVALEKSVKYILEECAIVILFRLQQYDSLFYLGKISLPIEYVATLSHEQLQNKSAEPLTVFEISKYKVITHNDRNSTCLLPKEKKVRGKTMPAERKHLELAYQSFFNSPVISSQEKIDTLLRLTFFKSEPSLNKSATTTEKPANEGSIDLSDVSRSL